MCSRYHIHAFVINPINTFTQAMAGFRHEFGVEGAFGLLVAGDDVTVGVGAFAVELFVQADFARLAECSVGCLGMKAEKVSLNIGGLTEWCLLYSPRLEHERMIAV